MSELTFDDLSEDQKNAHDRVIKNIRNKIHTTITGGPGVGKTTLVKFVFETLKKLGISGIWLTAPTHQAKNVLSEAVGMDATTIHSALKISPVTNEELRVFEQQKGKKPLICLNVVCLWLKKYRWLTKNYSVSSSVLFRVVR